MRLQLRCHGDIDLSQPGMQVEIRTHIARCLRDYPTGGEGVITLAGVEHCFMYIVLPLAALAQQRTVPVIGFLSPIAAANATLFVDAFRQGLKETGFVDGQNVKIEYRWAEGQYDRLPALAAELVKLRVAVIAKFRTQRPSHICETSRCRALLKRSSYVTRWRRDWLAGLKGLELRNVIARYLFEKARGFSAIQPNLTSRDHSRVSCEN